ncbi:MAG TPA: hypothetical protein PKA46_02665 [Ferruginibacter sp.]|nr:hypothetical protein [Ferruginibacter sp.]
MPTGKKLFKHHKLIFKYRVHKILHWEYWPQWLLYLPVLPVYVYYACRARHLYFNVPANPGLENGGYLMESKSRLHSQLPRHIQPASILADTADSVEDIQAQMQIQAIEFPCICKPDIGARGLGVAVVSNLDELKDYHQHSPGNYLLQQKLNCKYEVGIFYYRYPGQQQGCISGIVEKQPMVVTGNGTATLRELIMDNPRYYYQRHFLYRKFKTKLDDVLPKGKTLELSGIGNHARGSLFKDVSFKKTKNLENTIHAIATSLNGFYFGRLDIMYNDWEALCEGREFYLIELNGSGSEPTHIYDPQYSLLQAWKIIIQHWAIMYRISRYNMQYGATVMSYKKVRQLQQQWSSLEKKLVAL